MRIIHLIIISSYLLFLSGCFTIGHDFPVAPVQQIKNGETTQTQIRELFGTPWRTGIDDGRRTWTYGHYKYSVFRPAKTFDLVIKFNAQNIVTSHTFNTTEPSALKK